MTTRDNITAHPAPQPPASHPHAHAMNVLWQLRADLLAQDAAMHDTLAQVHPDCRDGARNLVHHLGLQCANVQALQPVLAELGLAAIDRMDTPVLRGLDTVLGLLHALAQHAWPAHVQIENAVTHGCHDRVDQHARALLGSPALAQSPRVMVMLSSATTSQPNWASEWVGAGMEVACIDCAQDTPEVWRAMVADVRQAAKAHKRPVKILMALAGTRLLTGDVLASLPLLKLKPGKDTMGRVFRPARLHLRPMDSAAPMADADASVGVWGAWLARLKTGTTLEFLDARGAKRHLLVTHCDANGAVAECLQTAYLTNETVLFIRRTDKKKKHSTLVCKIEGQPGAVRLRVGDTFRLVKEVPSSTADSGFDAQDRHFEVPHVTSRVPEVIDQARVGHRICVGSGRLCGEVVHKSADHLDIEVTRACEHGERLHANMALHLPDSQLELPEFTEQDQQALLSVAALADLVCLDRVHDARTVQHVQHTLQGLGREGMAMVLKVADRQTFERLPQSLLQAMTTGPVAIWLDRSALALGCGTESLASVQDAVLRCAKAAHAPVILATQTLQALTQSGLLSNGEMADAGLDVQAHGLVLQPGPHVAQAVRTLVELLGNLAKPPRSGRWAFRRPECIES